eukprot:12138209-Alexandrium_andersonii.AAC.1
MVPPARAGGAVFGVTGGGAGCRREQGGLGRGGSPPPLRHAGNRPTPPRAVEALLRSCPRAFGAG